MPKKTPTADTAAEAAPEFDRATAVAVPAYRHEPTARTVAFEQPLDGNKKALFSATRVFIARADGAAKQPAETTNE